MIERPTPSRAAGIFFVAAAAIIGAKSADADEIIVPQFKTEYCKNLWYQCMSEKKRGFLALFPSCIRGRMECVGDGTWAPCPGDRC